MKVIAQRIDEILESLQPLDADWEDATATRVIGKLHRFPLKDRYSAGDIRDLLDDGFDDGLLICRLFLGISKDQLVSVLRSARGSDGIGITSYRRDPDRFIADLVAAGVPEAMARRVSTPSHWSDVLVERLRSGRGSAISGQRRGRSLEDFADRILRSIFGDRFQSRCTFTGLRGSGAKCDFVVPSKIEARILIEAKGYGATGSKMTDILGDLNAITKAKRSDTALLFLTDGLTWKQRKSDLRKIVEMQNAGEIMRIYTIGMAAQLEEDLRRLKDEYGL